MTIPQDLDIQSKSIQPLTMAAMAHMFWNHLSDPSLNYLVTMGPSENGVYRPNAIFFIGKMMIKYDSQMDLEAFPKIVRQTHIEVS